MDSIFIVFYFFLNSLLGLPGNSHSQFLQRSTLGTIHSVQSAIGQSAAALQNPVISRINQNVGEVSRKKCLQYYPPPKDFILGVAGGQQSLAKEFPHMAVIGYGGQEDIEWKCGGSLISKKFIVTAAHCAFSKRDKPKFVRLGDLDLATEEDDAQPQDFTVVRSILHPSYQPPARYHDIALLELDREVQFSEYISPACLNTENELKEEKLTATGWGKTAFSGESSSFLLKVDLDHVPNRQCLVAFGKNTKDDLPLGILDNIQICAGKVKGQDTCQGDSGGPLQLKNLERSFKVNVHNIIGVTSFGKACALSASPSVYTRISNYIPWIESIVWENETEN